MREYMIDSGSGNGIRPAKAGPIPLLFKNEFSTVCIDSFILKMGS
jgi:hypothetical protein